jgi:hypothetical protein
MNIQELFEKFSSEAEEAEKLASDNTGASGQQAASSDDDQLAKLAEDLEAAGREFGEAAVDAMLQKLAMGIPAGGRGIHAPEGPVHATAKKLGLLKGEQHQPGDDTSIRAEETGSISGNPAPVVNPQANLPKAGM